MEQTPHGENPFPGGHGTISSSVKNTPMLFGVIALIIVAAGVIWYISDTSKSTPTTPLPPQSTTTAPVAPAIVNVPLANTADLPAIEASLGSMDANLKTLDDLKDI
jgi:hypothetical protein